MRSAVVLGVVVACGHPPSGATDAPPPPDVAGDDAPESDGPPPDAPPPTGPALFAIERGAAVAGDTLTLEGTFDAGTQIRFPGGTTVAATVLGAHRARVTVPAAATIGALDLVGAGPAPISFHHTAFAIDVDPFAARYDQLAGPARGPVVLTARNQATATVAGHALYVAGGFTDTGIPITVERAIIHADGSLGAFGVAGNLTVPRGGHTATVIGKYLYLVGGDVYGQLTDSVDRAEIHADGTLGPFAIDPTPRLVKPRSNHTAVVIGDGLFVIGGVAESMTTRPDLDSVERAQIFADGTLGPFAIVPGTKLGTARAFHTSAVVGDGLYVAGGGNLDIGLLASVERAAIQPDGTLGPFVPAGNLAVPRGAHASAIVGRALYMVGGVDTAGKPVTTVERAPIQADGTLGAFAAAPTTLVTARRDFPMVVAGDYVYGLAGAASFGAQNLVTCERARIDGAASVETFAAATGGLAAARSGHATVVSGSQIYVIGGADAAGPVTTIERAAIHDDGSLDAFAAVAGATLVAPRAFHSTLVAGGFVHVIGGRDAAGAALASVERAPIMADGTIGPFAAFFATLVTARHHHASLVVDNKLFVFGGKDAAGAALDTVESAIVNPNGSITPFAAVTGVKLATKRSGMSAVVLGNAIYVLGGTDAAGAPSTSIERAPINADGTIGTFAIVSGVQLALARTGATVFAAGRSLFVTGGRADASVERASIAADGTLGTFAVASGITLAAARGDATAVMAGDAIYVIGGAAGGVALAGVERARLQ